MRQLTSGEWQVDSIAGIDQKRGVIYFTGSKDGPTERHLYRVSIVGGEIERLTPESGTHVVALDHRFGKFVDVFSDTRTPPTITLRSLDGGSTLHTIHAPDDPRVAALALSPPELVSIEKQRRRRRCTAHSTARRPRSSAPAHTPR